MIDLKKATQYRLYTYDVWGNQNDGWDVNRTYKSAWTISKSIYDELGDEELTQKIEHILGIECQIDRNCSDDTVIYFSSEQGEPVCELRVE